MGIISKGPDWSTTSALKDADRWTGKRHGLILLKLVLVLGWFVLVAGCGVKGPPVPLQQTPALPSVTALAHRVADGQVTLTWQLQSALDSRTARQASFIVRRSRTALDQPSCENCPQVFETVGNIPYVETADGSYALKLGLDAGFRYVFMVHLRTGHDVGPDCDPVQFDYPMDKPDNPEVVP